VKPTRQAIDQFFSQCTPGTQLTCLDNTFIPKHVGFAGTVTKTGRHYLDLAGGFRLYRPKTVAAVISLTDDTITYYISDNHAHTATWKVSA
jgi:hypothetical protein